MRASVRGGGLLMAVIVSVMGVLLLRPHSSAPASAPLTENRSALPVSDPSLPTPSPSPKIENPTSASAPLSWNGVLEPVSQATLSVMQPGRIMTLSVRVGDHVRRGQTLLRLEGSAGQSQEVSARAGLKVAQAQLEKARAGREAQRLKADADLATAYEGLTQAKVRLRQARLAHDAARVGLNAEIATAQENTLKAQTQLKRAQETLAGLETLAKVGGVARNDLEGARAQVETARADLNEAQTQVRALTVGARQGTPYRVALAEQETALAQSGVRQAQNGLRTAQSARRELRDLTAGDLEAASAAVTQAQAGLAGAQAQVDLSRLVSPMEGIVGAVMIHVGETAQPDVPLMTLVSSQALRVTALALARQLPYLSIGQIARIDLDTRPGRPLAARLATISRSAEPDGRSFRITFSLLAPPRDLRRGQNVRITLAGK